jgi:hypothetical protein
LTGAHATLILKLRCSAFVAALTDIGDMPYALVGRFLADMPAAQLAKVELNSPVR